LWEVSDGLFVMEEVLSGALDFMFIALATLHARSHLVHDTFIIGRGLYADHSSPDL